jgi:hypothetical protein
LTQDTLPIACSLSSEELETRGEDVARLFALVEEVEELTDGYSFRFPAQRDLSARLLDFVLFERECCPFFTFELRFEPGLGPTWLSLRGPEGVKQFVAESGALQAASFV